MFLILRDFISGFIFVMLGFVTLDNADLQYKHKKSPRRFPGAGGLVVFGRLGATVRWRR
jgi:hypothetical protein